MQGDQVPVVCNETEFIANAYAGDTQSRILYKKLDSLSWFLVHKLHVFSCTRILHQIEQSCNLRKKLADMWPKLRDVIALFVVAFYHLWFSCKRNLHQNLMQVSCTRNLRKFPVQDSWLCVTSISFCIQMRPVDGFAHQIFYRCRDCNIINPGRYLAIYRVGQKNRTLYSCPYLCCPYLC